MSSKVLMFCDALKDSNEPAGVVVVVFTTKEYHHIVEVMVMKCPIEDTGVYSVPTCHIANIYQGKVEH